MSFNCTLTPCKVWSPCIDNTCICPTVRTSMGGKEHVFLLLTVCLFVSSLTYKQGYHGGFCELRWMDDNPTLWEAFRWTAVGINIVLALLSTLFVLQYWWRKAVEFPRLSKPMIAQVCLVVSLFVQTVVFALDPYRFYSYAGGWLTVPYGAGMVFLNGLSLPLLLCAYAFVAAFWVTVRSKQPREAPDQWSTMGAITFWAVALGGLLSAVVNAVVWGVTQTPLIDKLYFGWLLGLAGFMCVILGITSISTLVELRRFSTKNAELSKSVARHALIMAIVFGAALVGLIITISVRSADNYAAFMIARNLVPLLLGYMVRLTLAIYYKHKVKYETRAGKRGTVLLDVKSYASAYVPLLDEGGDSDQGVYCEGGF